MPDPSPRCSLVAEAARYPKKELRSLRFDGDDLTIEIQGPGMTFARVVFECVIGFRVLDEGDLLEFWNTYSEPNGWLWLVESGGWLELERRRPMFDTMEAHQAASEYLLVDEMCVSILTRHPPTIVDVGRLPEDA